MDLGDRSRCLVCGGKIVLVDHPSINLNLGMWIHVSGVRRFAGTHPAEGPNGKE